jgi:hypothetical protein
MPAAFSAQTQEAPLSNAVILIIRHAEKPEDGDGLTAQGMKRAQAYVHYFETYRLDGKPLRITHLFAATDSKKSKRPRLTIEPLSVKLHQPIDLRFSDKDPEPIVEELKSKSHGNEILIAWRHGKIPALLTALGADSKTLVPEGKWPEDIYDRVIELHFDSSGKIVPAKCHMVLEHLLRSDER